MDERTYARLKQIYHEMITPIQVKPITKRKLLLSGLRTALSFSNPILADRFARYEVENPEIFTREPDNTSVRVDFGNAPLSGPSRVDAHFIDGESVPNILLLFPTGIRIGPSILSDETYMHTEFDVYGAEHYNLGTFGLQIGRKIYTRRGYFMRVESELQEMLLSMFLNEELMDFDFYRNYGGKVPCYQYSQVKRALRKSWDR